MTRILLPAIIFLSGCAGDRMFFVEARGDSIRLAGASDAVRLAANRILAGVDVPALARECGVEELAAGEWEIRRGTGEFAGGDALGTGRTISLEARNETLNEDAPPVPSLAGKRMRGVVKIEVRTWPHRDGVMADPGALCPQAEVDLVVEPGLEMEGRAFAKRLAERALKAAVEAVGSAQSGK